MKNIQYFFENNKQRPPKNKVFWTKGSITYKINIYKKELHRLELKDIRDLVYFVNWVNEKYESRIPITFDLKNIEIEDKLIYILLEILFWYIINNTKIKFMILLSYKSYITSCGIKQSPLIKISNNKYNKYYVKQLEKDEFSEKFKFDLSLTHYRRIVFADNGKSYVMPSIVMSDVKHILERFYIDMEYVDKIAEVVAELLDNAIEHAKCDCIVDVDISDKYNKKDDAFTYRGVNITIINFSKYCLGDHIKHKVEENQFIDNNIQKILKAREYHKLYWNDNYTESDFYLLSSFQNRVSGRRELTSTGGTGLTKLISSIEEYSDAYNCYVISSNKKLNFIHEYLKFNEDKWVGFNSQNDFMNEIPDKKSIGISGIYMPGTAYNLNFVFREREK